MRMYICIMHRVEVWKTEGKQPHTLWGRTRERGVCFFSSGDEGALLMRRGSASAAPVDGSEGPPRRRSPGWLARSPLSLSLSLLQVRQSLVVASARAHRVAGQRERTSTRGERAVWPVRSSRSHAPLRQPLPHTRNPPHQHTHSQHCHQSLHLARTSNYDEEQKESRQVSS